MLTICTVYIVRALHISTYVILTAAYEVCTVSIPILHMGKLRFREIKQPTQDHTDSHDRDRI